MRRAGFVLASLVVLAVGGLALARPAHAMEIPPVSSMDAPTKTAVKTRMLTWPSAPGDDLLTGMWRARTAAAVEPAVGAAGAPIAASMGTVVLAGTAGYVAYKITDAIAGDYLYRKFAGTDPTPTGTVTVAKWAAFTGSGACDALYGAGVTCWHLQTDAGTGLVQAYCTASPVNGTTCPYPDSRNADRISYHTAQSGLPYFGSGGYTCTGCSVKTRSNAAIASTLRVSPMTAAEFAAAPSAQRVTAPSPTASSLTDAQAQAGLDAIHAGDEGAQNAEDAAATDHIGADLGFDTFSMPGCLGQSVSFCGAQLDAAGQTGARTFTTATTTTADPGYPPGTVIVQPYTAGTTQELTVGLTFLVNPAAEAMPFTFPAPLWGETGDQYRTRLQTAGYLGTITLAPLTEATAVPVLGAQAVVSVKIGTTTVRVATPVGAPLPAPGTASSPWSPPNKPRADTPVEIAENPPGLPAYGETPGDGDCPCPVDAITLPDVASPCDKFPFGVFCWIGDAIATLFLGAAEAPSFHLHVNEIDTELATLEDGWVDMSVDFDDLPPSIVGAMNVLRLVLSFLVWLIGLFVMGRRMLGAGSPAADGVGDGSEDASAK